MNPFDHMKFVFKNIFELFLPDFLGLFSKIIVQIWRRIKKESTSIGNSYFSVSLPF